MREPGWYRPYVPEKWERWNDYQMACRFEGDSRSCSCGLSSSNELVLIHVVRLIRGNSTSVNPLLYSIAFEKTSWTSLENSRLVWYSFRFNFLQCGEFLARELHGFCRDNPTPGRSRLKRVDRQKCKMKRTRRQSCRPASANLRIQEGLGVFFFPPLPPPVSLPSTGRAPCWQFSKGGRLHHVNGGLALSTYVKVFCILPDWTVLHVALLRVLEAEFQVLSGCVDPGILFGFHPRLDLAEGNRTLDSLVIIRIVTF